MNSVAQIFYSAIVLFSKCIKVTLVQKKKGVIACMPNTNEVAS